VVEFRLQPEFALPPPIPSPVTTQGSRAIEKPVAALEEGPASGLRSPEADVSQVWGAEVLVSLFHGEELAAPVDLETALESEMP
jgi:hypothetical protein